VHDNLLAQVFLYLAAAVVVVPVAKRLGLGSVLGYLLAGVVLGPYAMKLVGREGQDVMHFAEFGVVMMLFLVGLELKPTLLWSLRRPILGLGGAQVVGTAAAVLVVAMAFGQSWRAAAALGLILAGSSTAIVLQSLTEKSLLRSEGGQAAFSVLLFQDIAVIPMLALFPLLAMPGAAPAAAAGGRPGWLQALLVLGAVAGIVLGGSFMVRPLFRLLAKTRLREIFTAAALALVIGIALLMQLVGLSPALGTFLAGVVLAESEYRHELESDIEPFKGLLLGVFFIAVGASIDFRLIAARPGLIFGSVLALVVLKLLVLLALGWVFRLSRPARLLLAFSLAQGGEFAFVLFSFAQQSRVLEAATVAPLVAVVALSMLSAPLMLVLFERVIVPRLGGVKGDEREADPIEPQTDGVVIAGYGRFGQIVGRLLRASGVKATVLDLDVEIVDVIRRLGFVVHYGDASRLDLLRAAGCETAKLLIVAVEDPEKALEIVETARRHFPHLQLLARARGRVEYYQLRHAGVETVVRETFGSALMAGTAALRTLGFRAYQAERLAQAFRHHDEDAVKGLEAFWGKDQKVYFAAARSALEETERLMKSEDKRPFSVEEGWDNESLRDDANSRG
jgi:glutathione-regulated potassium-efflux system ancillary protein KefC